MDKQSNDKREQKTTRDIKWGPNKTIIILIKENAIKLSNRGYLEWIGHGETRDNTN